MNENNNNRLTTIDGSPARLSTNFSIDRQTPKTSFGDRLKAGLDSAGGLLAGGLGAVGQFIPGGAILSAAVSSVSTMQGSSTQTNGTPQHMTMGYAGSGILSMSGTQSPTMGMLSTTGSALSGSGDAGGGLAGPGLGMGTSSTGGGTYTGSVGGVSMPAGIGAQETQMSSNYLAELQKQNQTLMAVQINVQRENQVYTAVSNLMKAKHDTVKNSIGNVR